MGVLAALSSPSSTTRSTANGVDEIVGLADLRPGRDFIETSADRRAAYLKRTTSAHRLCGISVAALMMIGVTETARMGTNGNKWLCDPGIDRVCRPAPEGVPIHLPRIFALPSRGIQ
jgi:hypothetical protein